MAACSSSAPRRPGGPTCARYCSLDDAIFTLKLTPNLAHGLSVYGVAREVAALTGAPLKAPHRAAVQATQRRRRCP